MSSAESDRLVALLADLFPVVSRSWWPFTVEQAADALIAAGVTVAVPSDDDGSKPELSANGSVLHQMRLLHPESEE